MTEILAFGTRKTNAQLVADLHALGYITDEHDVLDATYGLGRWWNDYRPAKLVTNDLFTPADHAYDVMALPWVEDFDVVAFDPPYKLNGTPSMGGAASSDVSYGVGTAATISERKELMEWGFANCATALREGGRLIVKCQDQVSSGKVQWQTLWCAQWAQDYSVTLVDSLHVQGYRAQPAGRRQLHARRDYSTCLVYQK